MDTIDRRAFLLGAGGAGMGAVLTLEGCGVEVLPGGNGGTTDGDANGAAGNGTWPLPYTKLDAEVVRKRGHQAFYEGDCCYGAFKAIVATLAEQVGEPFASIPLDMMRYGKGGVYGYGSLCGSLNGAAAAIQLVADEETAAKVITELFDWYSTAPLPTDTANAYAVNHEYLVDELKTDEALLQNVAGNVLCHV